MCGYFLLTVHDTNLYYRSVDAIGVSDAGDWSLDEGKVVLYEEVERARSVAQNVANLEGRSIWILNDSGYYEQVEPATQASALHGIALSMT